ncbi:cytoplasmic trehalase [Klebsiella michiganensis]|uniref:Cytoplasmic trehalase n=1 Tax=Klebsiella michiganensis TaxID=1134687 RepID=A0A7H4M4C0_9ENTR|nr:cytoplasmic trehalase [Klebsiella michiganensis]
MSKLNRQVGRARHPLLTQSGGPYHYVQPELRNVDDDELRIEIDPCYEADPYELKLDEMFDAEPEPEIIEGLPASDALTPADRYLELFAHVQKSRIFADSKTFPDCAPKQDRWIF